MRTKINGGFEKIPHVSQSHLFEIVKLHKTTDLVQDGLCHTFMLVSMRMGVGPRVFAHLGLFWLVCQFCVQYVGISRSLYVSKIRLIHWVNPP